ncbi:LuxR C-terminal-related transcriptional regulator [Paenibacillus sp. MSJ-34]|uniref:LuxR C-terminal-related transcriptional regulator n=1 Tax=Paenibacillus sp. MSJ-34 TaxID=2841529 RepID=UPI001C11AA7A|nr:LuxR C-terminal-related transcriptional regulator [Paenibacillus sp. MSJ-34]MBU5442240.1 LuxR C-terminal-related transcriptional regulator [Paenibacillus sp. MSJ-34]
MADIRHDFLATEVPIGTKLHIPESVPSSVYRSRLFERLDEGRKGKLTLICAPAGFGKTTLVSDWIRSSRVQAAWISLDEGDNQPIRFWRYMAAAFESVDRGIADNVLQASAQLASMDFEQAIRLFLSDLQRLSKPITVVLDDFHVIRDQGIVQGLAYLLAHLPDSVHFCIMSRTNPGFDLSRLEIDGKATCFTLEELRFSEREGTLFYRNCMRLEWDDATTAALVRKTEGWIAGLSALSFRDKEDAVGEALREFSGDLRQVERYLLQEVFRHLSEPMRQFLMKCSILSRWNAPLCQAVTGWDSRPYIEALEDGQLFIVPLDAKGDWYRFHHLFAEFLRKQLEKHDPASVPELYLRAGDCCRERQLDEEAIEYYLLGRHYDQAVELLEETAANVVNRGWSVLRGWLSSIPNAILLKHPMLYFSYALSLSNSGQGHLAERKLQEAQRWYEEASPEWSEAERSRYLGWIHYVRGNTMVFLHHDLNRAREHFRLSEFYAPHGIALIYGKEDAPLQAIDVRSYAIENGHASPEVATPYTMQMADIFRKANPSFLGRLYSHHGELRYLWNDLQQSEHYAGKALKWIEQLPARSEFERIPNCILRARLKAAEGKSEAAKDILHAGIDWMKRMNIRRGILLLETERARLALMEGDAAMAAAWIERYQLSASDMISVFQLYEYEFLARALIAHDRLDEAGRLLERLQGLAESELRPIDEAEVLAMHSLLLKRQGFQEPALLKLDQALSKAEANAIVRIFIDEGPDMSGLLIELIATRQQGKLRGRWLSSLEFARKILSGFGIDETFAGTETPLAALLTPRELDVLHCMREDLSARQIAERLQIGYETVKTHRSRIYGKLGVASRMKAIERAKELGLPE